MKILHLYGDLMNLYGEYANVCILERYLKEQGADVVTEKKSLYENKDFTDYDFVYIGAGTEKKQLIALSDLLQYRENIRETLDKGTVILATGNSLELFGEKIISPDGKENTGLGLFGYHSVVTDKQRTLSDNINIFNPTGEETVGFVNKASELIGADKPLFTVKCGEGNNSADKTDGYTEGNFFGTYLTGPLLVKNPRVAEFFVKMLCEKTGITFRGIKSSQAEKVHSFTLDELKKRFGI